MLPAGGPYPKQPDRDPTGHEQTGDFAGFESFPQSGRSLIECGGQGGSPEHRHRPERVIRHAIAEVAMQ